MCPARGWCTCCAASITQIMTPHPHVPRPVFTLATSSHAHHSFNHNNQFITPHLNTYYIKWISYWEKRVLKAVVFLWEYVFLVFNAHLFGLMLCGVDKYYGGGVCWWGGNGCRQSHNHRFVHCFLILEVNYIFTSMITHCDVIAF